MAQEVEALFLILLSDFLDVEMILQEAGIPVLTNSVFLFSLIRLSQGLFNLI